MRWVCKGLKYSFKNALFVFKGLKTNYSSIYLHFTPKGAHYDAQTVSRVYIVGKPYKVYNHNYIDTY